MPEETIALASADPSAQGRRAVADVVSRSATQIEAEIARVLARAAASYRLEEQQWIVDAARRRFDRNAIPVAATTVSVGATTPLKDEARRAFFAQRDLDRTLDLHLQAFGADPYDAEIAGNLASLYLRVRPLQPHAARQLVMHAIAVGSVQSRAPRAQDWSTFAIASALVGHDDDATHGLFVAAALATNLPGTCKTALNAVAIYGDRMRVPVESMLLRMQQQGRDRESPYCSFPPRGLPRAGSIDVVTANGGAEKNSDRCGESVPVLTQRMTQRPEKQRVLLGTLLALFVLNKELPCTTIGRCRWGSLCIRPRFERASRSGSRQSSRRHGSAIHPQDILDRR